MPLAFYLSLSHVISFKGSWNISISGLHVILYPTTTGIASKSLFCHVIMWDSPFKPAGCNLGHARSFLFISWSCYLVQRLLKYLYFQVTCHFMAHNHCIKNINLKATLFVLRWDNPNPWDIPMQMPSGDVPGGPKIDLGCHEYDMSHMRTTLTSLKIVQACILHVILSLWQGACCRDP